MQGKTFKIKNRGGNNENCKWRYEKKVKSSLKIVAYNNKK